MALVIWLKVDGQSILITIAHIPKAKGARSDDARPFLSEMTNTGRSDGEPYIEIVWHYLRGLCHHV